MVSPSEEEGVAGDLACFLLGLDVVSFLGGIVIGKWKEAGAEALRGSRGDLREVGEG